MMHWHLDTRQAFKTNEPNHYTLVGNEPTINFNKLDINRKSELINNNLVEEIIIKLW